MPSNTTLQDRDAGSGDPAVRQWRPGNVEGAVTPASGQGVAPEVGGRKDGTEPTRFGDWEKHGRCIDF
jgi:hypothetical protein